MAVTIASEMMAAQYKCIGNNRPAENWNSSPIAIPTKKCFHLSGAMRGIKAGHFHGANWVSFVNESIRCMVCTAFSADEGLGPSPKK